MFGHPHHAIMSGSYKVLPLNESLDSIHSSTSFAFAHFVPWRHYTLSKIKVGRRKFRTNELVHGQDFFLKLDYKRGRSWHRRTTSPL